MEILARGIPREADRFHKVLYSEVFLCSPGHPEAAYNTIVKNVSCGMARTIPKSPIIAGTCRGAGWHLNASQLLDETAYHAVGMQEQSYYG